eukprot:TRINITY_DN17278_c0_g1_i1.p2 TRINITY_DN17278_c0_g1~~TRINITY_DN17278_c0_g1_i1.p2  ORF type:complete len:104 (+),score=6.96 TRINITY_DN17278_c0_g1_i1:987-1298(+)
MNLLVTTRGIQPRSQGVWGRSASLRVHLSFLAHVIHLKDVGSWRLDNKVLKRLTDIRNCLSNNTLGESMATLISIVVSSVIISEGLSARVHLNAALVLRSCFH